MDTINWTSLGTPGNITTNPAIGKNDDGRLEAFVCAMEVDPALWHIWQTTTGETWSSWNSLSLPPTNVLLEGSPTVVENDDGRLEVFATGADNALWHIWQLAPNGSWSTWKSLDKPPSTDYITNPIVSQNQDGRLEAFVGRLEAFAIGSDNALWHIWQLTTGGAWGSWSSLGTPSSSISVFGDPFVAENDDGRLEAFAVGSDGALWHTWQVSPGGHWG